MWQAHGEVHIDKGTDVWKVSDKGQKRKHFPGLCFFHITLHCSVWICFSIWGQSKELTVSIIFYSFQELYSKYYVQGTFWPRVSKLLANTQSFSWHSFSPCLHPIFSPKELSIVNSVFQGRRPNPELVIDFLESPKFKGWLNFNVHPKSQGPTKTATPGPCRSLHCSHAKLPSEPPPLHLSPKSDMFPRVTRGPGMDHFGGRWSLLNSHFSKTAYLKSWVLLLFWSVSSPWDWILPLTPRFHALGLLEAIKPLALAIWSRMFPNCISASNPFLSSHLGSKNHWAGHPGSHSLLLPAWPLGPLGWWYLLGIALAFFKRCFCYSAS